MRLRRSAPRPSVLALLALAATVPTMLRPVAADAQDRPTVTAADYGRWERLGRTVISHDGRWLAAQVARVGGQDELRIHRTDSDSVVVVPFGQAAAFSDDGRWLVYQIGRSEEEREAARREDRPVHRDVGVFDLAEGRLAVHQGVETFQLSADGRFVALHRYGARDQEHAGRDLIVEELATRRRMVFGNVAEIGWSDSGHLLAMVFDARDRAGNGVSVYDPGTGGLRPLDQADAHYRALAWRDDAADLAVLRTVEDDAWADTAHVVLAWSGLDGAAFRSFVLEAGPEGVPGGTRVAPYRAPTWSGDGGALFVGIQPRTPALAPCAPAVPAEGDGAGSASGSTPNPAAGSSGRPSAGGPSAPRGGDDEPETCVEGDEVERPGLEIWHARDVQPVPQQRVRERQLREESHLAAWHLERGAFVSFDEGRADRTELVPGGRHVLGLDETPYAEHGMFRQQFHDLYAVDPASGVERLVAERVEGASRSPDGRYLVWFAGEDWFAFDLEDGRGSNLTEAIATRFVNLDVTPTREQMPSFGVAGWMAGDRSILLNDRWDVWEVPLDGTPARRLTAGAEEEVRWRLVRLDPEADAFAPDAPLYYHLYAEWTKQAGFARALPGETPERLIQEDAMFGGGLLKARDADVLAFRRERFDDSPDWFVAGPTLASARQVTRTNPFHADFAWGRTELVDYENEWGRRMQGVLAYPANYDPDRSYPLIVYHYELLSQGMHQYHVPDPEDYYNQQIWSQEGYFVFRPDVVYRDRRPGQSNVETLRPAVAAVLATGLVDPERIGLIGHSWGGYQTTFFVTQEDLFTAAVAGAPLTNLMSMYLSFYWNSGGTDARIFEISQARMQVPWWEDWDSYFANSPVHHIENMRTPLLMMFGTDDGAVEFNQGVEFYNAARRLGKEMVMLVYEGENHHLAEKANRRDYHTRILQWFGHYLKGEPAPEWLEQGVGWLEQKDGTARRRTVS